MNGGLGKVGVCREMLVDSILIKDDLKISLDPAAAQNVSPILSGIEIIALKIIIQ